MPRARRSADAVYWNDEYEPALRARDDRVEAALRAAGVQVQALPRPAARAARVRATAAPARPYTVYTPFRRACEALPLARAACARRRSSARTTCPSPRLATLERLGFAEPQSAAWPAGESHAHAAPAALPRRHGASGAGLARYASERDFPSVPASSQLSADFKFGTLGIRRVAHGVLGRKRARPEARRARREVRAGTALARLLRARAVALPARRARRVPSRVRCACAGAAATTRVRRVVRRPDRLPDRGCRHARAAGDRLHAQPRAHDRGERS